MTACVRQAASVKSEPGLNPPKQPSQDTHAHEFALANLEYMDLARGNFTRRVIHLRAVNAYAPLLDETHGLGGTGRKARFLENPGQSESLAVAGQFDF